MVEHDVALAQVVEEVEALALALGGPRRISRGT